MSATLTDLIVKEQMYARITARVHELSIFFSLTKGIDC
ncbi:uncharacterized protein METZ01_LOCUS446557 [marine metagenome]|uniref:Uncharacterized protein n=1 Tax=marine metagenome TaxID=408172 RepID=A0A382ZE66_9ZZZZ